jgi:hypothetical protein
MIVGKPRKKETNMSKNLTRKGLAFGAGIALVASGLAGLPAQADTTGPITLVPTQGTTFNSILQSGFNLKSDIDPSIAESIALELTYLVENPGAAAVTATFTGSRKITDNSVVGTYAKQITVGQATAATSSAVLTGFAARTSTTVNTHLTAAPNSNKFIYVSGASNDNDGETAVAGELNLGGISTQGSNTLGLTTSVTDKTVTLYVTAWLDANRNGVVDTFEQRSDRETVTLYPASAVSAVTTVDSIVVGTKVLRSTVVYGNDVNPHMVAADTGVQILKDGVVFAIDGTKDVGDTGIVQGVISTSTIAGDLGITKNTITVGPAAANGNSTAIFAADATVGIYSAIAVYNTSGAQTFLTAANVRMGAPSQILDLSAGNNAAVDKMTLDVTNTANYKETVTDAEEIYVRTGTKSVTFGVQARDGTAVLKAANIGVRAIVTETALDAAAEITISGSTGKLVDGGAAITAYGVTDSNGQASFTITSKNGKKNDAIDVAIQFKVASGVWTTINAAATGGVDGGLDIKWFATAFSSFTPKPAAYVSGANPVVTFKVTDQWSQPVSFIDDTRLSVYASAYVGGVENTTKYAERVTVVDGLAAFTFANFAATGGVAELRAILYKGAESNTATSNVTVYNTAATSAINVATSFKTDITYNDYVTGSSTDTTVAAALVATGLGADTVRATIAGNVNNTTGSGQPGAAVTLSAAGVLFYDSAAKVYALNTITTTSNEYGAWTVFAYSHTVNAKGAAVSITSGTVSASTKLITYLPKDLLTRDNLVFSFDVPATLVMNTTYAVVAKLADKWGNPVQTAGATGSVSVVGNGSAQVNGVTAATVKDFDLKGEATVFIRSLKDIAGPSSVTATLLAVTDQYTIDPTVTENGTAGSDTFGTLASTTVDVTGTAWNETTFAKAIAAERDVVTTAPAASADTKVNVGTFKGYVALYAKGYKGQKMTSIRLRACSSLHRSRLLHHYKDLH